MKNRTISNKVLTGFFLLAFAGPVFSKGHPCEIGLDYNGNNIFYTYLDSYYSGTNLVIMSRGDSCCLWASAGADNVVDVFELYRHDSLVYVAPETHESAYTWIKIPGKYTVKFQSSFDTHPGTEVFVVMFPQPTGTILQEPLSSVRNDLREPVYFVSIYPNPTAGDLSLRTGDHEVKGSIRVMDLNGKQIWNEQVSLSADAQYTLPAMQWQAGVYFVEFFVNNSVQRFKVVKN